MAALTAKNLQELLLWLEPYGTSGFLLDAVLT